MKWLAQVFALLTAISTFSATYHVATNGNDSADGSVGTPWLTVQKAGTVMVAGDTAIVTQGVYPEKVTPATSGTAANPIRYTTSGTVTVGGFDVGKAYLVIDGFSMDGTSVGGYKGVVNVTSGGYHLTVRSNSFNTLPLDYANGYLWLIKFDPALANTVLTNCIIADNRFMGTAYMGIGLGGSGHWVTNNYFNSEFRNVTTNSGDRDALRVYADNVVISDNVFTNWTHYNSGIGHADIIQISTAPSSTNGVFERNLIIDCDGMQLGNIDDAVGGTVHHWTFRNNIYARVGEAFNVWIPDMHFHNNTFYRCTTNTGHPLIFQAVSDGFGAAHRARIYNNIFFECGSSTSSENTGYYEIKTGITNALTDYNLVMGTGAGTNKSAFTEVNGVNGFDPLLVSATNFRLQAGSPAIDAGMDLSAFFTTDFAGNTRAGTWDIGAYDDGSTNAPVVATNVTTIGTFTVGNAVFGP